MNELRAPVYEEAAKPDRKYHLPAVDGEEAAVTTEMRRADGSKNLPVDDDFEWRLELSEYASDKLE